MESLNDNELFRYASYTIVALIAILGITCGFFSAVYGRKARAKRKKIVEAVVLALWSALVPMLLGYPTLSPYMALAGGFLALCISGGIEKYIYKYVGAIIGGLVGLAFFFILSFVNSIIPLFEISILFRVAIVLVFSAFGATILEKYREYVIITSTAYAGANLFAFGFLGGLFLFQEKPLIFIQNILVTAIIPFVGGFFEQVTFLESILYGISFLVIMTGGWLYQNRQYQQE